MTRLLEIGTKVSVWIGGLLIICVIFITVGDVFARKFFNTGYFGLVDVTQLAVIGFAYLAMPRAFLTEAHVAVELYDHKLSPRADIALRLFTLCLSTGVLSILLWYGWIQAARTLRYGDVSQNVQIPMIWYWGLLLGGILLSWIICVIQLVTNLTLLMLKPKHD